MHVDYSRRSLSPVLPRTHARTHALNFRNVNAACRNLTSVVSLDCFSTGLYPPSFQPVYSPNQKRDETTVSSSRRRGLESHHLSPLWLLRLRCIAYRSQPTFPSPPPRVSTRKQRVVSSRRRVSRHVTQNHRRCPLLLDLVSWEAAARKWRRCGNLGKFRISQRNSLSLSRDCLLNVGNLYDSFFVWAFSRKKFCIWLLW